MNSWIAVGTHWLQHSGLAALFLDACLKSLVILSCAGGLCLVWRRGAAAARHLVWFLAVAGVLCLPGLSRVLPAAHRPLWTVGTRAGAENELALTVEFAPTTAGVASLAPVPAAPAASPTAASGSAPSAGGQRLTTHFRAAWAAAAVAVWLGGAGGLLLWLGLGRLRLRALRRTARPCADGDWHALLRRLCEAMQIQRPVTLLQSAQGVMPATWGWWRPVILLPAEAAEWPSERRRVVLLHELAHVQRWDCLTQLIAQLACAVYWFNPLVWVAARRMGIERERACDDLVLNGGCQASEYAAHLVEIARSYRRVPQMAAIAMARSSHLEGRIAAIVDASRTRRAPRALLVALCGIAVLTFVAAVAAPRAEDKATAANGKPWFDARLRAFFAAKAAQAHQLDELEKKPLAPEVWPYFQAGMNGDWQTATNLWWALRQRAGQYQNTKADDRVCDTAVWSTILETDLAWEQFANWKQKYVLAYGNDIIRSIPPGSIYFGGTDPGRGVITALSESHADAKPFFTLTQNALANNTYMDYLRAMYGQRLSIPSPEESQQCFQEYMADAQQRLQEHKLKPGEDVRMKDGKVQVSGQVSVMAINGLLTKVIFEHNPSREFYIEESFPLDWMYPHLSPNGLILKINRQPLPSLSEAAVQQDHQYWAGYLQPMLGDWLQTDTSVAEVAAFTEKVYLNHDLSGFSGDPQFLEDTWAQKAFSKLRSSIAGVYAWRVTNTQNSDEKQRMTQEADFAFRQAYALCPTSPDALFRYVNLLLSANRVDDAITLAQTTLKLDPKNEQVKSLMEQLKQFKVRK